MTIAAVAVVAAGCGGGASGLSTSSKCADYNEASRNDQVRWLQKSYGPHQTSGSLNSTQVAEASEVIAIHCGTNPDLKLGQLNYDEQMHP